MPVQGDVYKLTTHATWHGQVNQNVYFYRAEDDPTAGIAQGLATEWIEEILPLLVPMQADSFNYNRVHVVNLFDAADVYEEIIDIDGEQACGGVATEAPSFNAQRATLVRDNARVKNGAKYYGGLCEQNISGDSVVGLTSAQTAFAAELAEPIFAGIIDELRLVLVKRTRVVVPDPNTLNPDNLKYAYGLPESQSEMGNLWAYVREVAFSPDVSHMDSRQKGKGV